MPAPEKRLRTIFSELESEDKDSLLAFAEFLHARSAPKRESLTPNPQPRPANESVIAAIKRLSQGYPMLNKAILLNETSSLMSRHMLQGEPAEEVIDQLEVLFLSHYQKLKNNVK